MWCVHGIIVSSFFWFVWCMTYGKYCMWVYISCFCCVLGSRYQFGRVSCWSVLVFLKAIFIFVFLNRFMILFADCDMLRSSMFCLCCRHWVFCWLVLLWCICWFNLFSTSGRKLFFAVCCINSHSFCFLSVVYIYIYIYTHTHTHRVQRLSLLFFWGKAVRMWRWSPTPI
jgi:hypothetical protein